MQGIKTYIMKRIIEILKNVRKQNYLQINYKNKYAFVGIGNHSINNLYPIINYFRVPLKYIVVKSNKNAALIDSNFKGIIGTTEFNAVLNDPEIKGIFICTNPQNHFDLVKKGLEHNKFVFVEKPPCTTKQELDELIEVEKNSQGTCLVGMQKRYAPIILFLKKNLSNNIISYNYRFTTGAYPEGDSVLDLFIHPLDIIAHIFGKFTIASIQISKKDTYFIHLLHNGFIGSIELSTSYTWKNAEEKLIINTESGIYEMKNMEDLTFQNKSKTIFSIPLEKVIKMDNYTQVLFNRNNFNPIQENNQLVTSGYFNEIKNFINLCENKKGKNLTTLSEMKLTFDLIFSLKK